MGLTPERKAALLAERKALFAELKRRFSDRGIAGVSNAEFVRRQRGVPIEEAEGDPTLDQSELDQLRTISRRAL